MKRKNALLLLVLTAFFWSLSGLMIKKVNLHPVAISGWRSAIAVLFLLVWKPRPRFNWSWPQIGGGCAYAVNMFSFVGATKLTTAANAILLQYTAPAYVALFGIWFLRERPRPADWLAIGVILAGMVLFFLDRLTFSGLAGNVMGVLAGISFAWIILFLRKQKEGSAIESVILGNLLTAVLAAPLMIKNIPVAQDWWWLIGLGTVQTGVPYILYTTAIRYVTALEGVLVPMIEPILNPAWALIFVGEIPGFWAIVGGTTILLAVTFRAVLHDRSTESVPHRKTGGFRFRR
jgi:drug/metabolite transporter (DMT)-like permease